MKKEKSKKNFWSGKNINMAVNLSHEWKEEFKVLFRADIIRELINKWNSRGLKPTLQHIYSAADPNDADKNPFLSYLCADKNRMAQMVLLLADLGLCASSWGLNNYKTLHGQIMKAAQPQNAAVHAPASLPSLKSASLGYSSLLQSTDDRAVDVLIAEHLSKTYNFPPPNGSWINYEGAIGDYFSIPGTLALFRALWVAASNLSEKFPKDIEYKTVGWKRGEELTSFFRVRPSLQSHVLQAMYVQIYVFDIARNMISKKTLEELGALAYSTDQNYTDILIRAGIARTLTPISPVLGGDPLLPAAVMAPPVKVEVKIRNDPLPPAAAVAPPESTFSGSIFFNGVEMSGTPSNEHIAGPEEHKCTICMENATTTVFLPCLHQCLCFNCGRDLIKNNGLCPSCRGEIKRMLCPIVVKNN